MALEITLSWGDTVLETLNVVDQPVVTMGDEPRIEGHGPFKKVVRCDLDVPSRGLPERRFPIALSTGSGYEIAIHSSFGGSLERSDGTRFVIEKGGAEVWHHPLEEGETLHLNHGFLTLR